MLNSNSPLATYQALIQEHAQQFDPELQALQQLVQARMQELQEREQTLVNAQAAELKRITQSLATDARCLLPTPEFQAFVQELKRKPVPDWYSRSDKFNVSDNPTTWQLVTLDLPVSLSDYQTDEDPYAYDDERTHTLYTASFTLKLGHCQERVAFHTERYYHPQERHVYSMNEQIGYFIANDVEKILRSMQLLEVVEVSQKQLVQEISILVRYAATLFTLTPRTAQFDYAAPAKEA